MYQELSHGGCVGRYGCLLWCGWCGPARRCRPVVRPRHCRRRPSGPAASHAQLAACRIQVPARSRLLLPPLPDTGCDSDFSDSSPQSSGGVTQKPICYTPSASMVARRCRRFRHDKVQRARAAARPRSAPLAAVIERADLPCTVRRGRIASSGPAGRLPHALCSRPSRPGHPGRRQRPRPSRGAQGHTRRSDSGLALLSCMVKRPRRTAVSKAAVN